MLEVINEPLSLKRNRFLFRNLADGPERFWILHFNPSKNFMLKRKSQVFKHSTRKKESNEVIRNRKSRKKKPNAKKITTWAEIQPPNKVVIADVCEPPSYRLFYGIRKQLQSLFDLNRIEENKFEGWSFTRIKRLFNWLARFAGEKVKEHPRTQELFEIFTGILRSLRAKKKKANPCHWFCLRMVHPSLKNLNFGSVFKHALFKNFFNSLDPVKVSFSLGRTVGSVVLNMSSVTELDEEHISDDICKCNEMRSTQGQKSSQEHLVGHWTNLNCSGDLRKLFELGLWFRLHAPQTEILEELYLSIDTFTDKVRRSLKGESVEEQNQNERYLNSWLKNKLSHLLLLQPLPADNTVYRLRQELANLKENFVFLPIDKARHDVGVMCKTLYLQLLRKEISSYSLAEEDMFKNLEATKKKLNFSKLSGSVPYLYGNLKLHKLPDIRLRWIAGTSTKCEVYTSEKDKKKKVMN